jgi:hypothetical protein
MRRPAIARMQPPIQGGQWRWLIVDRLAHRFLHGQRQSLSTI